MSRLQTSGAISMVQVGNAFNVSSNVSIGAFIRGGASNYVSGVSIAYHSNIPASVPISFSNFYGAGYGNYINGLNTTNLVAAYTGESYRNGLWYDCSGNGRTATVANGSTLPTVTTNAANFGGRTFISGTTATNINFPYVMNSTYTILHVVKYNGGTCRRIITTIGSTPNWLSGFWNGGTGVAYHEGWITSAGDWGSTAGAGAYGTNNWLLSVDQNNLYRANGRQLGTSGAGAYSTFSISINAPAWISETSDFSIACLLVYNAAISYSTQEAWLASTYGIAYSTEASTSIPAMISGAATKTQNLASISTNCTSYSVVSNPAWITASISGSTLTVTGNVASSSTGTVICKANAANGSFALLYLNVSQSTSNPYYTNLLVQTTTSPGGFYANNYYTGYLSNLYSACVGYWNTCNNDRGTFYICTITVTRTDTGEIVYEADSTF